MTTENTGGRNWFFSHEYVVFCEAEPAAVAAAVARLNAMKIPRHLVREATLQKIKRERLLFYDLVNRVLRECGQGARRAEVEFSNIFYDKINYTGRQLAEFLVPETPDA